MIVELPSRATTQAEIDLVKKHMGRMENEGLKYASLLEVRTKLRLDTNYSTKEMLSGHTVRLIVH